MRRFFKAIVHPLVYWYYWVLDYIYIGIWQVLGFFRKTDIQSFLQPTWQTDKKQVIMLPGIYERWDFMKPVAKVLIAAGYSVHVVEGLGYNTSNVKQAAEIVEAYVVKNNLKNCVIVAHSKGGLIGKYILSKGTNRQRFNGLVALNTPFNGSLYAYLLPFASLRIFTPSSPLLKLLAKDEAVNEKIVSIYNRFDPHIPGGSFLKGARNARLSGYGHFRIIKDPKAHDELLQAVGTLVKK
jgi:triacylglycerol lipase